jgi:TetR/AcrR family transcriptional repressor of nem operon
MEVLTEKGYCATGIDEILRRVGIPKGSFYHYFDNKDAFGLELIDHYSAFFKHKLEKFFTDTALSPIERLQAFMQDATENMTRFQFKRGCLVGNLGQEMGALPEAFRDRIHGVFIDWQGQVESCLKSAQIAGEISQEIDCAHAAYVFWTGWEGAVLRAKLERSSSALDAFSVFFLRSLK